MGLPVAKHRYTIAEYLKLEAKSKDKNEFHNGEILAMAGGTFGQSTIKTNLVGELRSRLRGGPCRALDSDMRVRIPSLTSYLYPDASIICDGPQFDPDDPKKTTIINPKVIFEVLSESTESYDRDEKFALYRELESFREYVLFAQGKPRGESFLRQDDGGWLVNYVDGLDATLKLRSVPIELPLSEIYLNVDFPPKSAPTPSGN